MIESLRAQTALIAAQEAFLADSTVLLSRPQDQLPEIDATNDLARKREVIERYLRQIVVASRRVGPRRQEADVRTVLRLKPEPMCSRRFHAWTSFAAVVCRAPRNTCLPIVRFVTGLTGIRA